MFDRYSLATKAEELGAFFSVDPHGFQKPRYNAAPSQLLPVITMGSAGLSHFYWGAAPEWAKNKPIAEKLINTKFEQIQERPTIRKQLKRNRCVVPADGFYGWKKVGKKTAIPYRFELKPKSLFAIAGIWDEYDDEEGNMIHTFTVITLPATVGANAILERMPAILTIDETKQWLNPQVEEDGPVSCLHSWEGSLENFPVSPRIHDTSADDASMILPTPPSDQFGNLTLFS